MRPTRAIPRLAILLFTGLLAGCGGTSAGQQGEIIGVKAQTPLEEVQSGEINNLTYVGTVVVLLPDNEEVIANCTEECLSIITEAPVFNVGQFTYSIDQIVLNAAFGYFEATITIILEEHQNVIIDRNETDEWEVIEVLE